MKLSDFHNEEAVDLLADIIEPVATIASDEAFSNALKENKKAKAVRIALKNHKKEVIELLARLNNCEVEEYDCTIMTIIRDMLVILNDKELTSFFTSATQKEA